jgi:hypothetical protein
MAKINVNCVRQNHISVDSTKIRIPLEYVDIISDDLVSDFSYINLDTGEVDEESFKKNCKSVLENGISTRYAIETQQTKERASKKFLVVLLTSKILGSKYFEGIDVNTLKLAYDNLMSHNVVRFTFDVFKAAECTDTDFKKDSVVKPTLYSNALNHLRKISKPSKLNGKGYRYFSSKDNKGISYSDRKTTSFKTNPFLKIYHKQKELENRSFTFSDKYLNDIDFVNLVRIETTVKSKAHFRTFGIETTRLFDLVNLPQEKKQQIMQKALSCHLEPRTAPIKDDTKLTPTEIAFFSLFSQLMKHGVTFERQKNNILNLIENKSERSRLRKKLHTIYDKALVDTDDDIFSKENDVFWTFLNW